MLIVLLMLMGVGAFVGSVCTWVVMAGVMPWWLVLSTVALILFAIFWGGPRLMAEKERRWAEEYDSGGDWK